MHKKANIVLLLANPNDETSNGIFLKDRNWYHLYIITNEEVKKGDWWIDLLDNRIFQVTTEDVIITQSDNFNHSNFKKIIATTDKSLKIKNVPFQGYNLPDSILPQPSQSFIEKFVDQYNQGNIITDVLIEYEELLRDTSEVVGMDGEPNGLSIHYNELKVNSDNTINIQSIKNSWNREELKLVATRFRHHCDIKGIHTNNDTCNEFDNWIEESNYL